MRKIITALSPRVEFILVIGLAFGFFIITSLVSAFHPLAGPHHTNRTLLSLAIYESVITVVICAFLGLRGWTPRRIGLAPTMKDTGIGLLLFIAAYAAWIATWIITALVAPQVAQTAAQVRVVSSGISPVLAVVVSLINPVFEEIFVTGYVMTALRDEHNPWRSIHTSVAIRLGYHLYQGVLGVLTIVPIGLLFAFWFQRRRRLWPLIVAHAVMDMIALLTYSLMHP